MIGHHLTQGVSESVTNVAFDVRTTSERGAVATRVYFEGAKRSVFAVALEWPGWCRRAKTEEDALESLLAYRDRYAAVLSMPFRPGKLEVVGSFPGNATTVFGAPDVVTPWDHESVAPRELRRQVAVLGDCWAYFDAGRAARTGDLDEGTARWRPGPRPGRGPHA